MGFKRHKHEEIGTKLLQAEVLVEQRMARIEGELVPRRGIEFLFHAVSIYTRYTLNRLNSTLCVFHAVPTRPILYYIQRWIGEGIENDRSTSIDKCEGQKRCAW